MRTLAYFMACILVPSFISAQTAFHNFGNVQMHGNSEIGFHTDLINDGNFENTEGTAGFYSDNEVRVISGTNRAIFYNVEIDASNNLQLNSSLGIRNNLDFVNGKVLTPRNDIGISLDFIDYNLHVGEDNNRHVDGYTSVIGTKEFIFPIGDDNRLRPMITPAQSQSTSFKGAYFFENPNSPSTFPSSFDTSEKQFLLGNVSDSEYWDLNGNSVTVVTLTWDQLSNIANISSDINNLTVVGWSKTENRWMDLGGNDITGDQNSGRLTSESFIPDNFEVITIGAKLPSGEVTSDNFLISPNDDQVNDSLIFEGLETYKQNRLTIVNRWGNTVLEVENYKNDWKGISEGRLTVDKSNKLPSGTYFYVLTFGNDKLDRELKGWVYINN